MDRSFVFQKSYTEDKWNPDGIILYRLVSGLCPRNLDICTVEENASDICTNKEKENYKTIPVGTLEYVQECLNLIKGTHVNMRPIELPEPLWNMAGRVYRIVKGKEIPKDIIKDGSLFIKDADHLKKWNNLLTESDCSEYIQEETNYVVSTRVDFLSEYRVFVHRGEVLAVQNYLGNPLLFPNEKTINSIVRKYEITCLHPQSYTLDIGVIRSLDHPSETETVPIEIHPFTSCGLYGFLDRDIPDMLEDGINWYLGTQEF